MKPKCKTSVEVLAHIDQSLPVQVYRNLTKKCLSVRQGGIVRCHVVNIVLRDCDFHVGVGRRRVLKTKHKNVHAWVKGTVVNARETDGLLPMWEEVSYNPYTSDSFTAQLGGRVATAKYCDIDGTGSVLAHGLKFKKRKV